MSRAMQDMNAVLHLPRMDTPAYPPLASCTAHFRPRQSADRLVQLSEVEELETAKQPRLDVPATVRLLTGFGYKRNEKREKFILQKNEREKALNLLCILEEQKADIS